MKAHAAQHPRFRGAQMPPKFTNRNLSQWLEEQIAQHNSDECLLWPFNTTKGRGVGYGLLTIPPSRKKIQAHRLAFKLAYGRWPMPCGLHSCDTPTCFNPRHIFEGTIADNNSDMHKKGRAAINDWMRGEDHSNARLSEQQVLDIRARYTPRLITRSMLAREFGVSEANIKAIISRQSWRHI